MADDSTYLQQRQKEQEILKTTEQFSKKFKNVIGNLQEVNTPLAKTIADLRETTKGSFKAAANAKELQEFTDKVAKATSKNADKTTKSYQKLSEGLDRLSGTSGFLDQLKVAQDNYSLNQLKAMQLEQDIADTEFKNRKAIQDFRDKIAKLELDRIRAEGLGQEENLKKITAEKEKQEKALTKFETEIFDTKREELEIQKNLLDTSKSNLEKLNETVDKQAKEIAEQDTKFTMFGQGLKELTGFDLLGTLDSVVDKIDAVGKIFGNKDLSGTIASAFSLGGGDDIVASIAGESQELDPKIKIAKKELRETEDIAEENRIQTRLLRMMLANDRLMLSQGDKTEKTSSTIAAPFLGASALLETLGLGYGAKKGADGLKKVGKGGLFSGLGSKFKNLIKSPVGKGGMYGLIAAALYGIVKVLSGGEDEQGNSEMSALTRGLNAYQNNKISDKVRPDELAAESYDSYSLRGSMGDFLKDFDDNDPRKVDKLFNKDGTLDKRTKFYQDWKAHNLTIRDMSGGATDKFAQADYEKAMKINPQELDDMIDGYKNDPMVRKFEAAKIFDKNFAKSASAKLPILGSGLDVFFDNREQKMYGENIDLLETQGLLSGDDLKTVDGAERANNRGSVGRGIGSWAGGLLGAAIPAAAAVALGSNPVGWGIMAASILTGIGGAMLGGSTGDKIATFDGGSQELTAMLSEISQMDIDDSQKENMIMNAIKKYKGMVPNMTPTEIVLKNASEQTAESQQMANSNYNTNTNIVTDNRSTTINSANPMFRNPDDTARLVDVKYS